jgi:hypothetical protein
MVCGVYACVRVRESVCVRACVRACVCVRSVSVGVFVLARVGIVLARTTEAVDGRCACAAACRTARGSQATGPLRRASSPSRCVCSRG